MNTVPAHIVTWLHKVLGQPCTELTMIQPLWSGYGACFRALTADYQPVVVKAIQPRQTASHPKGWKTNTSHQRKCQSFLVEQYFYQHLQPCTTSQCPTAALIASDQQAEDVLLVMEDLFTNGYRHTREYLTVVQSDCVLRWLAAFHSRFLGCSDPNVWQEGTYWHLATRQDELAAMPDSVLKQHAHNIASALSNARYQTLLHGDAKVANFCFDEAVSRCAAVDFQYSGMGVGVKDVAYFIGSALSEADQHQFTGHCLDVYFSYLHRFLAEHQPTVDANAVETEWRNLYDLACADFHRFLAGWSPEHWKINDTITAQTWRALSRFQI